MVANCITLARFPLLAACLAILYLGSPSARVAGAGLLFLALMLDTVDGVVARKRAETSLIGSVLDIAADRTYELALWVSFALFELIPAVIPLVVLGRTTLTDALRSLGVAEGAAPFDQPGGRLARFLVSSGWMRTGYSSAKIAAFCSLALAHASLGFPPGSTLRQAAPLLLLVGNVAAWLATGLCILRGMPVIVQGFRDHWPRRRGLAPTTPPVLPFGECDRVEP